MPSADDWQSFCRDQGLSPELQAQVPAAESPQLLEAPLAPNLLEHGELLRRWATERVVYAALATLLVVPAGYFGGQWASYAWQQHSQQRATAELKESAAPIVAARAAVFADSDFIEAIGNTQQYASPVEVLGGVAQSLRVEGLAIAELDYKPGSLRIQMSNLPANFSVAEFVDRLSAVGLLDEVQATLDGMGSMTLTANVRKRRGGKTP
jgi:type II secretory pathway component PulM